MELNKLSELGNMIHRSVELMSNEKDINSTLTCASSIDFSFKEDLMVMMSILERFIESLQIKETKKANPIGFTTTTDTESPVDKMELCKQENINPDLIEEVVPYDLSWRFHKLTGLCFSPNGQIAIRRRENMFVYKLHKNSAGYLYIPSRKDVNPVRCIEELFFAKNKPVNGRLVFIDGDKTHLSVDNLEYKVFGEITYNKRLTVNEVEKICDYLVAFNGSIKPVVKALPEFDSVRISGIKNKKAYRSISDEWFILSGPNKVFKALRTSTINVCDLDRRINELGGSRLSKSSIHTIINTYFKDKKRSDVTDIDICRLIKHYDEWIDSDDKISAIHQKLNERFHELEISMKQIKAVVK